LRHSWLAPPFWSIRALDRAYVDRKMYIRTTYTLISTSNRKRQDERVRERSSSAIAMRGELVGELGSDDEDGAGFGNSTRQRTVSESEISRGPVSVRISLSLSRDGRAIDVERYAIIRFEASRALQRFNDRRVWRTSSFVASRYIGRYNDGNEKEKIERGRTPRFFAEERPTVDFCGSTASPRRVFVDIRGIWAESSSGALTLTTCASRASSTERHEEFVDESFHRRSDRSIDRNANISNAFEFRSGDRSVDQDQSSGTLPRIGIFNDFNNLSISKRYRNGIVRSLTLLADRTFFSIVVPFRCCFLSSFLTFPLSLSLSMRPKL